MSDIGVETGKRIRHFRKSRAMTLEELAALIHKSKATLSKYEKGEISLDLDTLYDLAAALRVQAEQFLPAGSAEAGPPQREIDPEAALHGACEAFIASVKAAAPDGSASRE